MSKRPRNDPRWTEHSASLRQGQLFVKLPASQACLFEVSLLHALQNPKVSSAALIDQLRSWAEWFGGEIRRARQANMNSVILGFPAEDADADAQALSQVEEFDVSGRISHFRKVMQAGLRNEPDVDWIARVGGPARNSGLDGLIGREPPTSEDLPDLEELFSDS